MRLGRVLLRLLFRLNQDHRNQVLAGDELVSLKKKKKKVGRFGLSIKHTKDIGGARGAGAGTVLAAGCASGSWNPSSKSPKSASSSPSSKSSKSSPKSPPSSSSSSSAPRCLGDNGLGADFCMAEEDFLLGRAEFGVFKAGDIGVAST